MKKFLFSLALLAMSSAAHAGSLGNCTVQYWVDNKNITQQCGVFTEQREGATGYGIGVRVPNSVVIFTGDIDHTDEKGITWVKVKAVFVNSTIDENDKNRYDINGFCKFRSGNAVECEADKFMLNGTY